jgi:hypothetical protein
VRACGRGWGWGLTWPWPWPVGNSGMMRSHTTYAAKRQAAVPSPGNWRSQLFFRSMSGCFRLSTRGSGAAGQRVSTNGRDYLPRKYNVPCRTAFSLMAVVWCTMMHMCVCAQHKVAQGARPCDKRRTRRWWQRTMRSPCASGAPWRALVGPSFWPPRCLCRRRQSYR